MEKDDEVKGKGNSYTTEFRQLDSRLGRWLSLDPKISSWESPFVTFTNSPILFTDKFGDKVKFSSGETKEEKKQARKVLRELKKDPTFKELYKKLKKDDVVIEIEVTQINSTVTTDTETGVTTFTEAPNDYFDASTNKIVINAEDGELRRGSVAEEFFHAYQKTYYSADLYAELKNTTALESEAKLFRVYLTNNLGETESMLEAIRTSGGLTDIGIIKSETQGLVKYLNTVRDFKRGTITDRDAVVGSRLYGGEAKWDPNTQKFAIRGEIRWLHNYITSDKAYKNLLIPTKEETWYQLGALTSVIK